MEDCSPLATLTPRPLISPPAVKGEGEAQIVNKDYKCTICPEYFEKLQDCLKHELLRHNTKRQQKRPQKTLRTKLNSILKAFKEDDKQTQRASIHEALATCSPGQELATIFQFHRMNAENLEMVYMRVCTCLKKELQQLGDLNIYPFGSIATGLALRDSDIDLYIDPKSQRNYKPSNDPQDPRRARNLLNRITNLLYRSECFNEVIAIRQARVPIIKCKHAPTGFSLDINLSCPSSVHNTNFLQDLIQYDARVHELMIFLKVWAKQLQIIGRGNMTSYCLITLVLFYLQQPTPDYPALLPSIQTLQSGEPPVMVMGVNYAYNLSANMRPLPETLTVEQLVKDFFAFYRKYDFEHTIVAPHLGTSIPLEDFKTLSFAYEAYEQQIQEVAYFNNAQPSPLQVDRCMCVQDPFSLNHNVAKSINPPNLEYFRKCLQHAHALCIDSTPRTHAELYETLMYDIVGLIARAAELEASNQPQNSSNNLPNELNYRFTPCRAEMRAISTHAKVVQRDDVLELWIKHYTEVIIELITEVYCLDMQSASPTHGDKHQRLENANRSRSWLISGSVDQWTGRVHQRNGTQTFMEYQRAQTEVFRNERRQNAAYAVQLSGMLTINTICNSTAMEVVVTPRESAVMGLCKKDPLRKFFTMFKSSMQNFNLKERLHAQSKAATKNT